jgi:hypothetical protein
MTSIDNKPDKIDERINTIKTDIKHYLKSIRRLKAHAEHHGEINRAPHAPRIIKYSCIPRSEKRFQWTLRNITTQVKLLEIELETLIKYGK